MRKILAWTLLAAFAAPSVAEDPPRAAAPIDGVTWIEGGETKTRNGIVVKSAGFDHVVFSQGARRTTLDGADVVEVRWGDVPREFENATAALVAGDAETALAGFDAVLNVRTTSRGWLVERGSLGLAEARLALAGRDDVNLEKAAHAFGTARDANPRSFFLDGILGGLARTELLRGHADAALTAADELEAAARTAKRPLWQCVALLWRARALEARHDPVGARRAVDDAIVRADAAAAATKDGDLARRLKNVAARAAARKAWLAVAEAEQTSSADASTRARKLIDEVVARRSGDSEAEAAAVNATGVLLLAGGDAKAALRKFLESEVVHFDAPDEAACALWYQSKCFERLGDKAAGAAALRRLAETYPESEWARRAR